MCLAARILSRSSQPLSCAEFSHGVGGTDIEATSDTDPSSTHNLHNLPSYYSSSEVFHHRDNLVVEVIGGLPLATLDVDSKDLTAASGICEAL